MKPKTPLEYLILEILEKAEAERPAMEQAAKDRGISLPQLITAAIMGAIREN